MFVIDFHNVCRRLPVLFYLLFLLVQLNHIPLYDMQALSYSDQQILKHGFVSTLLILLFGYQEIKSLHCWQVAAVVIMLFVASLICRLHCSLTCIYSYVFRQFIFPIITHLRNITQVYPHLLLPNLETVDTICLSLKQMKVLLTLLH